MDILVSFIWPVSFATISELSLPPLCRLRKSLVSSSYNKKDNKNFQNISQISIIFLNLQSTQIRGWQLMKRLGFYGSGLLLILPKKPQKESKGDFWPKNLAAC